MRILATTLAALSFATCQSPPDSDAPSLSHLIMAWDGTREPASLDGHIEPYQPAWLIDSLIADPLLILGPDGGYHPALATSWTSSPEADAWTFTLRDDVTFQDGTPFDAEAVKYNVERILAPETQSAEMAAQIGPVDRVEVVDATTVTLHYKVPWVTVLDAFRRVPIWSPTAVEKWGLHEFAKHLVGAGPFTLSEWTPNDHVTVEKWDGYRGWNSISDHAGPAHLDRVTIQFISEEAVLGNVVRTGNAHIAMNLPVTYIEDYRDREGFRLVQGFQAGTGLSMTMNTRKAPWNILEFRQALLYGTDQEAVNDLLFDGSYLIADGPLNTVHPCYWDGNAITTRMTKTRRKRFSKKSATSIGTATACARLTGLQGSRTEHRSHSAGRSCTTRRSEKPCNRSGVSSELRLASRRFPVPCSSRESTVAISISSTNASEARTRCFSTWCGTPRTTSSAVGRGAAMSIRISTASSVNCEWCPITTRVVSSRRRRKESSWITR